MRRTAMVSAAMAIAVSVWVPGCDRQGGSGAAGATPAPAMTEATTSALATTTDAATTPSSDSAEGMDLYTDPTIGWSIEYPADWQVDGADPSAVRISDSAGTALVGVYSTATDMQLDEFVDAMLASQEDYHQGKRQTWNLLNRRLTTLPDGTPAADVVVAIGPGGMSHQLYAVADGMAFSVNAETAEQSWDRLRDKFDRIVASFSPPG